MNDLFEETEEPEEDVGLAMMPQAMPVHSGDKPDPRQRLRQYLEAQRMRQERRSSPEAIQAEGMNRENFARASDNAALGGLLMNSASMFGNIGGKMPDSSGAQQFAQQIAKNNESYQQRGAQDEQRRAGAEDQKMKVYQYLAGLKDKEDASLVVQNQFKEKMKLDRDKLTAQKNAGGKDLTSKYSMDLASDWDKHPETKNTRTVQTAYGKMQGADSSAAGDMSLIFGFMKMQDPSSTVREGEYASAENARGVPDKFRNLYNKVMTGERLTPEQRAGFKQQAKSIYQSQLATQGQVDERTRGLAKIRGVNPSELLITDWQKEMPLARQEPTPGGDGTAIASPAQTPVPPAGKIAVSNGSETLFIDPADEQEALTEGFRRTP